MLRLILALILILATVSSSWALDPGIPDAGLNLPSSAVRWVRPDSLVWTTSLPDAQLPRLSFYLVSSSDGALLHGSEPDRTLVLRFAGKVTAESEIGKVLEPFYRVEPSRSRETGGSGLGLTLARAAAQAHGGALELENRPEGGLTARLRILARAAAAA